MRFVVFGGCHGQGSVEIVDSGAFWEVVFWGILGKFRIRRLEGLQLMAGPVGVEVPGWEGWFFEFGFLCSPNGDRFTPLAVMACFFWRQLQEVSSLMRCEPGLRGVDAVYEGGRRSDSMPSASSGCLVSMVAEPGQAPSNSLPWPGRALSSLEISKRSKPGRMQDVSPPASPTSSLLTGLVGGSFAALPDFGAVSFEVTPCRRRHRRKSGLSNTRLLFQVGTG